MERWEYQFPYVEIRRDRADNGFLTEGVWELDLRTSMTVKGTSSQYWESAFAEMGRLGWELVSVVPISGIAGGGRLLSADFAGFTTKLMFAFRRRLPAG